MDRISTQTCWLCRIMLDVLGFAWCGRFLMLDFDFLRGSKHWNLALGGRIR